MVARNGEGRGIGQCKARRDCTAIAVQAAGDVGIVGVDGGDGKLVFLYRQIRRIGHIDSGDIDDRIEYLFDKPNSSEQKFSNVVSYFYVDKTGVIWVSGKDGGVNKIISSGNKFKLTSITANSGNRSVNEVRAMIDRKSTRLNSSHPSISRMPSSA